MCKPTTTTGGRVVTLFTRETSMQQGKLSGEWISIREDFRACRPSQRTLKGD